MVKNLWKRGLAGLMAFTLLLTPAAGSKASEVPAPVPATTKETVSLLSNLLSSQSEHTPALAYRQDTSAQNASAKQLAASKAKTLLSYGATSIQYALIDNGRMVISGQDGFADVNTQTAPDKNTMYGIGSISKVFATTAVMQLVEKGKINLDSPVTDYVPDFKMADERYKKITVRMLLNHSSGLRGSTFLNAMLFGDNDRSSYEDFLKNLSSQKLKADPGAFSVYCNDGFTLAELVVERVSGQSFSDYMRTHMVSSLMNYTKTPDDSFPRENLAGIYAPDGKTQLPYESLHAIGAGGIYSTAENLCYFAETFMKRPSGILSEASVNAMAEKEYLRGLWPEDTSSILNYGLGWDSVNLYPFEDYGIKAYVKGGDTSYNHGSMIVIPEYNIAFAALSVGGSSIYHQIMGQEVLLSYLKEKGIIDAIKEPSPVSSEKGTMPAGYEADSGIYTSFMTQYSIDIKDSIMKISFPYQPASTLSLSYTQDGWFSTEDGTTKIKPVKESNGNTYLMTSGYSLMPGLGTTFSIQYEAQKIDENPISQKVKNAWKAREGVPYLLINEKYSSSSFLTTYSSPGFAMADTMEGYIGACKITDANNLICNIQIPGTGGRDLPLVHTYQKNGIEYLDVNGFLYINPRDVGNLSSKKKFNVTLAASGYAKYYNITSASAGKTITVTLPKNSAFVVINKKDGAITFNSYLTGKNTATLPENGYIMFNGTPGAEFTVQYK